MSAMTRRDFIRQAAADAALVSAGAASPPLLRTAGRKATRSKVIILGFDGMDHRLIQRWLAEGKLPAFARLVGQGGLRPLRSSIPPQSPVAWSNFVTGTDPGGHGIFDFMHRDPKTYWPVFSGTLSTDAKTSLKIGDLVLPLRGGEVKNLMRGRAFWQILEDHDIPATIFKIPSNYPPVPTRQRTISGMGTPDLKGSYGILNFYTTKPTAINEDIGGARIHQVYVIGDSVQARLPGPVNTFKKDRPDAEIDFRVFIDPLHPVAKIRIQDQEFILREKEWSGWKTVRFDLLPTQSADGICMFYLKELRPDFKLYVSPINIDPSNPVLPISTPASYAKELADKFGPFFTKGLPADTSALDNGILDEEEFLEQDDMVLRESERLFDYEFSRFDSGLLFYYVSSTDQRQHMFWRFLDENHPQYDARLAARFGGAIENIYRECDRFLGRLLQRIDPETVLIVMSDHGFNTFRRQFNLNTWLFENGYHRLRNPFKLEDGGFFENTDWSRTRAYGVGLNGLYINRKGREAQGLVNPGADADNLIHEIAARLEQTVDPKTGERAVLRATISREAYRGAGLENAPDIICGYNHGCRISWGSPLGKFSRNIFEDNNEKWSGDHLGAPEILPGILAANRPVRAAAPALFDLTATILAIYGIAKPPEMIGDSVF